MTDSRLRWQLRQLPREMQPERELWSEIAARLPARTGVAPRPRRRWMSAMAVAAALVLGLALAWRLPTPASSTTPGAEAELVRAEAEALTRQYQAALSEFGPIPTSTPLTPAFETLDRSALDLQAALSQHPDRFLLDRLRQTYSRRLDLTQRLLAG